MFRKGLLSIAAAIFFNGTAGAESLNLESFVKGQCVETVKLVQLLDRAERYKYASLSKEDLAIIRSAHETYQNLRNVVRALYIQPMVEASTVQRFTRWFVGNGADTRYDRLFDLSIERCQREPNITLKAAVENTVYEVITKLATN